MAIPVLDELLLYILKVGGIAANTFCSLKKIDPILQILMALLIGLAQSQCSIAV